MTCEIHEDGGETCLIPAAYEEVEPFPCPDPDAPFCGFSCEEIQNCNDSVDTTTTVAPSREPMTQLPRTGNGNSILLVIALLFILVGTVLVRRFN